MIKRLIAGCIVALMLAGTGIFATQIILGKLVSKPRLIALIKARTGDDLTFDSLHISAFPQIGLTLCNATLTVPMPGRDPSTLLHAKTVYVSANILALLRRQISLRNVSLEDGAIKLERDAFGLANWTLNPEASQKKRATPRPSGRPVEKRDRMRLDGVSLRRMDVSVQDLYARRTGYVSIDDATFDGLHSRSPHIDIHARHNGTDFSVSGHVGSLADLRNPLKPWHVGLGLILGSGEHKDGWINFSGSLRNVTHLCGWAGEIKAKLRHAQQLQALFTHVRLPDIRGLSGRIVFKDNFADIRPGSPRLAPWYRSIHFEMIDLDVGRLTTPDGFEARDISLSARNGQDAVKFSAVIPTQHRDWSVQATVPKMDDFNDALQSDFKNAFAFSARVAPSSHRLAFFDRDGVIHVNGQYARDAAHLDVDGRVHHLPFGPVLLEDAVFEGQALAFGKERIDVRALKLRSRTLSFQGDGTLDWPKESLETGQIQANIKILDADLLGLKPAGKKWTLPASVRSAIPIPAALKRETKEEESHTRAPDDTGLDTPGLAMMSHINLRGMRQFDWTIHVDGQGIKLGDRVYDDAQMMAHYAERQLNVQLTHADKKTGPVNATISYDERPATPVLKLHAAPVIIPAELLARFAHIDPFLKGPVEIVGDVEGPAPNKAVFYAKMQGHVGISMVGGRIKTSAFRPYLPGTIAAFLETNEMPIRCLGAHFTLAPDILNFDILGVEAKPVSLRGNGLLTREDGALAFLVTPTVSIAGAGASTPLEIRGSLQNPRVTQQFDPDHRAGITITQRHDDACPALLAKAREGADGPLAAPPKKNSLKGDLLKGLGLFP